MAIERQIRLVRTRRSQVLRIPRGFELPCDEAVIRKKGNRLIVEPVRSGSLLALLATWEPMEEEFPQIDDSPPEPVDL